jgi:hypothetical protein
MADDPDHRGPQDRMRIDIDQEHEVRYWTRELGVNENHLREAIREVGPMADRVRQHLDQRRGMR